MRILLVVLLVAAVVVPTGAIAAGPFSDDDGSVHESNIEWLASKGITVGCQPGLYCPDDAVTRAQMATFIQRLVDFLGDPNTGKVDNADMLDGKDSTEYALKLYAVVNLDATLHRGRNVVSVGSLAPGHYEVIFNRDVSTCAYVATIGDPTSGAPGSGGSVPGPGIATVAPRYENANGVFIRTFDPSGNLLARGFYLQVMC